MTLLFYKKMYSLSLSLTLSPTTLSIYLPILPLSYFLFLYPLPLSLSLPSSLFQSLFFFPFFTVFSLKNLIVSPFHPLSLSCYLSFPHFLSPTHLSRHYSWFSSLFSSSLKTWQSFFIFITLPFSFHSLYFHCSFSFSLSFSHSNFSCHHPWFSFLNWTHAHCIRKKNPHHL